LLREARAGRVPENLYGNDIHYQIAVDSDHGMRLALGSVGGSLIKKGLAVGGMFRWDDTARYKVFQINERGLSALTLLDEAMSKAGVVLRPTTPIYWFAKYVDALVAKRGPHDGYEEISAALNAVTIE